MYLIIGLAVLLSGCSLFGVYDGTCCAFNPPGPPSLDSGGSSATIYGPSGQRLGTVIAGPTGTSIYGAGGARLGTGLRGR